MNTINGLWKNRFSLFIREIRKYGKYILNDHIKLFLVFAFGAGAYYYQQLLSSISLKFPVELFLAVLFSAVVCTGNVATYFREPDGIFLLPLEEKMKSYFIKSYWVSLGLQSYLVILCLGGVYPLYAKFKLGESTSFFAFCGIIFCLKAYHMYISYLHLHANGILTKSYDLLVRIALTVVLIYGLLCKWNISLIIIVILLMGFYLFSIQKWSTDKRIQWEKNIQNDASRLAFFYRIANMFTDVPTVRSEVKRRRWADIVINYFKKSDPISYLLIRAFVRNGNYLSMFLRQLVVGAFCIYLVPTLLGKGIVGILFLYLIGIQNMTIMKQYEFHVLWRIYPIQNKENPKSLKVLLSILQLISSIIFVCILMFKGILFSNILIILAVFIVFSFWFVTFYVKGRLKQVV